MMMNKNVGKTTTVVAAIGGMLLLGFILPTTVISSMPSAAAQTTDPNNTRMVWHTSKCSNVSSCDALAQETITALGDFDSTASTGQKDTLIFHYGPTQQPQQFQIDAMKDVTAVGTSYKGFEFFSIDAIKAGLDDLRAAGFRIISYDLEVDGSPASEVNDPVGSFETLRQYIASYNSANGTSIQVMAAPSFPISDSYASQIAPKVTWYHLQSQRHQDNDDTCAQLDSWVDTKTSQIETAKPALEDEITWQVTLSDDLIRTGKTDVQTIQDCMAAVEGGSGSDVDGLSIWWQGTDYTEGKFTSTYKHWEDTYS